MILAENMESGGDIPITECLTDFLMTSEDLAKLEARLSAFNVFRVLRADAHELRHSNMLAWLFNPEESHGLGELFLRRWLMEILHQAGKLDSRPTGWVSPIEVDLIDIERVDVHREFERIDLMFEIAVKGKDPWMICIENKVNSSKGDDQLPRYFRRIERRFASAERRIYVFLTKNSEPAGHPQYIESSYEIVLKVLDRCRVERADFIGPEPKMLIDDYRQILKDDFMEENSSVELARKIYLRHRRALDFIFENKIDPVFEATNALEAALREKAESLGIVMDHSSKGYVRFLPSEWDVSSNRGSEAWGADRRYLVCELILPSNKNAQLHITAAGAPTSFADRVWVRAQQKPFKPARKKQASVYVKPVVLKSTINIEKFTELGAADVEPELTKWVVEKIQDPQFRECVKILAEMLPKMETDE